MQNKIIIQTVKDTLKQEYNQSDYIDKVSVALLFFYLVKKYDLKNHDYEFSSIYKLLEDKVIDIRETELELINKIALAGLDKFDLQVLKDLFDIFNELDFNDLGKFLEDFHRFTFTKSTGLYSSLDSVVDLSIKLLGIKEGSSVLDLCSGYGNFLSKIENTNDLTGIEINKTIGVVSDIRLYFKHLKKNETDYTSLERSRIIDSDALLYDFESKKYDYVFCDAPFGLNIPYSLADKIADQSFRPIVNSKMSSAWFFVDQVLKALKDDGKAVIVLNNSPLFKHNDYEYRLGLALSGYIEMVIGLADNLLPDTSIPISLLVIRKNKSNSDLLKLIDCSNEFTEGRRINSLSTENINNILRMVDENGIFVDLGDLEYSDYNLNPKNYQEQFEVIYPTRIDTFTTRIFRGVQIKANILDKIITEDAYTYKVLSLKDIDEFRINSNGLNKVKVDHDKWDKYLLKEGDFILSAKGTKIKTAVFKENDFERVIPDGNLMVIRLNQELINPYYLKVFFDSKLGQKMIRRIQTGTFVISIGKEALSKLEITLLPIEMQQIIVNEYLNRIEELQYHKKKTLELTEELESMFDDIIGGLSTCN